MKKIFLSVLIGILMLCPFTTIASESQKTIECGGYSFTFPDYWMLQDLEYEGLTEPIHAAVAIDDGANVVICLTMIYVGDTITPDIIRDASVVDGIAQGMSTMASNVEYGVQTDYQEGNFDGIELPFSCTLDSMAGAGELRAFPSADQDGIVAIMRIKGYEHNDRLDSDYLECIANASGAVSVQETESLEADVSVPESDGLDFIDESGFLLDGISISSDELVEVYREFEDAFYYENIPEDPDEEEEYEHETYERIGADHGLTWEQARNVFDYVSMYGIPGANKDFTLEFGDLLDVNVSGTTVVIKAKIQPSYSNEATIHQNYFSVCDIIKNQGGDKYDSIQYWAVADMTDGSEGKVISFTVPKQIIDRVASGEIVDNKLGDYLDDLWILPSLQ